MMTFEVVSPIELTVCGQRRSFRPGETVSLDDERGIRLLHRLPGTVRQRDPAPGDVLVWQAADRTIQRGLVDYMHHSGNGERWAFVSIGETWAAINLKYAGVTQ